MLHAQTCVGNQQNVPKEDMMHDRSLQAVFSYTRAVVHEKYL